MATAKQFLGLAIVAILFVGPLTGLPLFRPGSKEASTGSPGPAEGETPTVIERALPRGVLAGAVHWLPRPTIDAVVSQCHQPPSSPVLAVPTPPPRG